MSDVLTESDLAHFTGSEKWYKWSPLFRKCVLTDGTKFLAEKAGAFWLMDAIASHQPQALRNPRLVDFQLWTLKKKPDGSATLTCHEDSDEPACITQEIAYTDFPLNEINLYCNPWDDNVRVIFLPSEY